MAISKAQVFIRVILVGLFLFGILSSIMCLTCLKNTSLSCHNKVKAAAKNSESCLSHCAKQKTLVLETESYSQTRPEMQILFNLKADNVFSSKNLTYKISIPSKFYPNEVMFKLLPSQIYLTTYFILAPPYAK